MQTRNHVTLEGGRPVAGFPTYYVFGDGRVYSTTTRMFLKPNLYGQPGRKYYAVSLQEDNHKRLMRIHRLVATAFIPNPDDLPQVNHLDGDKLNNHVSNLEWCTGSDNMRHAYATGLTSVAGELNGNAKLSAGEVADIRSLRYQTSSTELSRVYGVAASHIKEIWRGTKWRTL